MEATNSTGFKKKTRHKAKITKVKPHQLIRTQSRGTQRGYSSKPLKHSIVERILVFKTVDIVIFLSPKNFSSFRIS